MSRFTKIWALVACVWVELPSFAEPPSPRRPTGVIAPEQFGKVFRRARTAILQVRTSSGARAFEIGTLIGAEGELVFASRDKPPERVWVKGAGAERPAKVLAWVEATRLAVARAEPPLEVPLPPAQPGDLALEEWVVTVRFDARGKPEPFAGTVDGTERPHARDPKLGVVEIGTPAQPGSPVLSADGGLVAIALERGERRTRAVLLSSLTPFLREVVLGR